jgi:cysteine-rich repeat protein
LASAELCDDGDATNGDGCDNNCTPTGCGNGIASSGEGCDDGNAVDGDGCDTNCSASACGNGISAGREGCDDGNDTNGDGCDDNCSLTVCGNGVLTNGEACDDANRSDGDGCSALCAVEPLLIRSRPFEGAVAGCSAGGVRIQYGYDADHDGTLDDREVKNTDHVCSGAPGAASPAGPEAEEGEAGPAGLDTVSRLTRIVAGDETCAVGGVLVEFGRDRDRDGLLSDSEVEQRQTLCDATSPGSALFEIVPLDTGDAKCPSGGVSVRSGLDDGSEAGNGRLEADEVDSQRELCSSAPSVIIAAGEAGECGVRRVDGTASARWSIVALLLAAVTWMRRRRS